MIGRLSTEKRIEMCRPAILLAIVCKECGLEAERATKADGWLEDDGGGEEANIGLLLFNNIIVTLRYVTAGGPVSRT